ncbi:MAG TPA: CBS domain-containing protein [Azospirillum sp.]|nr:CBS domain-containing protein [Azospirillum sp.]
MEYRSIRKCFPTKRDVFFVSPDASVLTALEILAEKDVGALLVMQGDKVVGIISERDCVRKGERLGRSARDTAVREIMTKQVYYVTPDDTIDKCAVIMRQNRLRHLPVVENGQVVWVMSIRDIFEEMIVEEEHHIHELDKDRLSILNDASGNY